MSATPVETVYAYHQRSKHQLQRYAAGPDGLDWDSQPNPFRQFQGTQKIPLTVHTEHPDRGFAQLGQPNPSPAPLNLDNLGRLLELSLGLSAWKTYGSGEDRWSLRCNPSSGNLHPTEAYLITPALESLPAGVYHYHSYAHELELRCGFASSPMPATGVAIALSSIHWREAWKYGERAFRYCQHDVGHALGALSYAAAVLGWHIAFDDTWADADIASLLGLERAEDFADAEREVPDLLLWINPQPAQAFSVPSPAALLSAADKGSWSGQANRLSETVDTWVAIELVHAAAIKPATPAIEYVPDTWSQALPCSSTARATDLIYQRRSMQACDPRIALPVDAFFRIMDALLPRLEATPWSAWPYPPRLHLLLFIHRVKGLMPGLYALGRHSTGIQQMQTTFDNPKFTWKKPDNCPEHLPLYQYLVGDASNAARLFSCHQDIAANGAFSVGMLVEFDAALEQGAWQYRRLFWEAGLLGQVLYLEAEAAGMQGTGIGCYFDDEVHQLLGIDGMALQSLYHFTVGKGLVDKRLQTLPPYAHLER